MEIPVKTGRDFFMLTFMEMLHNFVYFRTLIVLSLFIPCITKINNYEKTTSTFINSCFCS